LALRVAGLLGLGFVWGWWTVPSLEPPTRFPAAALVLSAVLLQGVEVLWLLGTRSVTWLIVGWASGILVNVIFRAALRARERLNS
jgi:hypothetical protein